jgi:hypothetical protein
LKATLVPVAEETDIEPKNVLITKFIETLGLEAKSKEQSLIVAGRFMFNTTPDDILSHKFDNFTRATNHSNYRKVDCLVFDSSSLLAKAQDEDTLVRYVGLMLQSVSDRGHVHVAIAPARGDLILHESSSICWTARIQQHLLDSI